MAAVLFTQGCPLRCRYCHNPHLQPHSGKPARDWSATLAWLARRVGLLDAVVISGGEPLMQPGLAAALAEIRGLGFATGLHSAGALPRHLAQVLPLLDWIGLDIKAPFARYANITNRGSSGARAQASLDHVLASGLPCEVRTTVHTDLLDATDLTEIANDLRARGVRHWVLQRFRAVGCADNGLLARKDRPTLDAMLPALRQIIPDIVVR
jgi:anaerobic ribonucleoside-triphosphate reductase activating protein